MKFSRRGFLKATADLTALGVAGAVCGVGSYEYGVHLAAKWLTEQDGNRNNSNFHLEYLPMTVHSDEKSEGFLPSVEMTRMEHPYCPI